MTMTGVAVRDAEAAVAGQRSASSRNDALDFTKGALVLIMVLYHWLNYFVTLEWDVYRYLRFLTPSFILITGFIVSSVYLGKGSSPDRRTYRRLLLRGGKLLLLFTLLNLAIGSVMSRNYNGNDLSIGSFARNAYDVYVTGNGRAAFDVLVPISYFLLLAPLLLYASDRFGVSLPGIGVGAVTTAFIAGASGHTSANLEMVSIALLGMALGTMPMVRLNRLMRRPFPLFLAYAVYLVVVARWNVLFPVQVVGVCLSLALIYLAGVRCGATGAIQRQMIELGKYSLFAYIAQVVLLQLLHRGLQGFDLQGPRQLIPFAAALALTVGVVQIMSFARSASSVVDRVYRVVFA
jgi:peptidoglycan/LPS O-acetylase OafA/YrhL